MQAWLRRPRSLLMIGFALSSVAGTALAVLSAWQAGVGWDAEVELRLARDVLDGLPPGTLQDAYAATPILFEFYGTLNYAIVDRIGTLLSPGFTLDPTEHSTYVAVGLVNVLVGVIGTAALAYAAGRALRSALAAWFLSALLLTTPLWVGHLSMNFKDVPTAVGLTLITAGLVLAWVPSGRRWEQVVASVLVAAGTLEVLGSRANGAVLIAILLVASWLLALRRPVVVITSFTGLVVGLVLVWLQSPFAQRGMPQWLLDAAANRVPWHGMVRFAGHDLNADHLPFYYVPGWFAAQLPLVTTALLIAGLVVAVMALARRQSAITRSDLYPLTPVALQAVVLPLAVIVSRSTIYDATRHVLFALPALLTLAVLPIVAADRPGGWRRGVQITAFAASAVAVLAGLVACIRWHPYEYAFVNPIAGIRHDHRDWELDYWGLSVREGIDRLDALGADRVAVLPDVSPGLPFGGLTLAEAERAPGPYGVYVFNRSGARLPDACEPAFQIVRGGHVLGLGGICRTAE